MRSIVQFAFYGFLVTVLALGIVSQPLDIMSLDNNH